MSVAPVIAEHARVLSIEAVSPTVVQIEFSMPAKKLAFAPGSHIVVHIPSGHRNAYSLIDDGVQPTSYRIAVRRSDRAGGSRWLHERLRVGDVLRIEPPRCAFAPVTTARRQLYFAAGIGVTPILSHIRYALRWRRPFSAVYAFRDGDAPYLPELRALCGESLIEVHGRAALAQVMSEALSRQPLGTHAYACGPAGMLADFAAQARRLGWPDPRIHVEYFSAPDLDAGTAFEVQLASSGAIVQVPSGVSLLDALSSAGIGVPHMCRRGVCGQCRVAVLEGEPRHRDLVQTPAQRAQNTQMYACVSRAITPQLRLDL